MGTVSDATEEALEAATHLTDMDAGAVQALRVLAAKIDDLIPDPKDDEGDDEPLSKFDNVTLPTYLKYCESLGLTPAGRMKLGSAKGDTGGKLGGLRSVPRPKAAG